VPPFTGALPIWPSDSVLLPHASFGSSLVHAAEAPTCYDAGPLITSARVAEQTFFFGGNGYSEVCK